MVGVTRETPVGRMTVMAKYVSQGSRGLAIGLLCAAGFGCMAKLTTEGAAVQSVTDAQRERACEFITIVTGSENMGSSTGADAQSAMNKLRNAVAEAGGNAMRILSTDSDNNATTVTAEALRCDPEKLRGGGLDGIVLLTAS